MRELGPVGIGAGAIVAAMVALLILGACRSGFVPDTPPTPLLSGAGETQIAAYTGNHSFAGQIAWSPFDHLALAADGAYNRERALGLEVSHRYAELLAGWYTGPPEGWRLELLAGVGAGTMKDIASGAAAVPMAHAIEKNDQQFSGDFRKYILQANLGTTRLGIDADSLGLLTRADAGWTFRLTWVEMRSLTSIDSISRDRLGGLGMTRYPDSGILFLQPGAFARIGTDWFMLEGQAGFNIPTKVPDYSWDFLHLSFGARFIFGAGLHP